MKFKDLPLFSWFFLSGTDRFPKYKNSESSYHGTHIFWNQAISEDAEIIKGEWVESEGDYCPMSWKHEGKNIDIIRGAGSTYSVMFNNSAVYTGFSNVGEARSFAEAFVKQENIIL